MMLEKATKQMQNVEITSTGLGSTVIECCKMIIIAGNAQNAFIEIKIRFDIKQLV